MDKTKFLDLGKQPIANRFLSKDDFEDEFFYHLEVGLDQETMLVTHMNYVDAPMMFNDNYAYRGSMSTTMVNHFSMFSESMRSILKPECKVLEIGSNDGVFIKNWNKENTIAVEPCGNFAKETNELGYKTYSEFWTAELADRILEEHGTMDFIFSANCMCHIPDLDQTFESIAKVLDRDGIFVFEDPSLSQMICLNSYDQIYDEHPHIFSVTALYKILRKHGLHIIKVENTTVHGGSNRIWVQGKHANRDRTVTDNLDAEKILGLHDTSTYNRFAESVAKSKSDLVNLLTRCKANGSKVISYGATSKSTTVFNYCNIDTNMIDYITDTTPEKQGLYSPGTHIPVIPPEEGIDNTVNFAYLGAWNFSEEIKAKERNFYGKFITHVPTVRIL